MNALTVSFKMFTSVQFIVITVTFSCVIQMGCKGFNCLNMQVSQSVVIL